MPSLSVPHFLQNYTILLDKIPKYKEFEAKWCEPLDYILVEMIANADLSVFDNRIKPEPQITFKNKILKNIDKKTGLLTVKSHYQANGLGRFYPTSDISISTKTKLFKHTIFSYLGWKDIDIKKCHSTIISEVVKKSGDYCPCMDRYISAFDDILVEAKQYYGDALEKSHLKDLFNMSIYGGYYGTWYNGVINGDDTHLPVEINAGLEKTPFPFYQEWIKELITIQNKIYAENKELADILLTTKKLKEKLDMIDKDDIHTSETKIWLIEKAKRGTLMSYWCGIIENQAIYHIYKYLVKKGIMKERRGGLEMDGINIPPIDGLEYDEGVVVAEINELLKQKTGLGIKVEFKKFDEKNICNSLIEMRKNWVPTATIPTVDGEAVCEAEISDGIDCIIENDADGADILLNALKHKVKFCGGSLFFKNGNIWVNDDILIDNFLLCFIMDSNLQRMGANEKPVAYSKNIGGATALKRTVMSKIYTTCYDDDFLNKIIETTTGRLCFLDGVLDFPKKKFYKWDEIDFEYYSCIQIKRNYASYFEKPNNDIISTIKRDIFDIAFGNDVDRALHFFSRAIGGHYQDKRWGLYMGNRNCGKGVIDTLAKTALGEYHKNCDAGNFLCNSNRMLKMEMTEKQMAFALDFRFARIVITQELPPPTKGDTIKVNADIIKKIFSGGDILQGKRNYDKFITSFTNLSTLFMCVNDAPPFTNNDVLETCLQFNSVISFKTKEEIEIMKKNKVDELILKNYKVADPLIKQKCKTAEYADAFIYLMVQNYKDTPVVITVEKKGGEKSSENDDDSDDDDDSSDDGCLLQSILGAFEITKDNGDRVSNDVIKSRIYGDVSIKKIGIELRSLGLKPYKSGSTRGWRGIKEKKLGEL